MLNTDAMAQLKGLKDQLEAQKEFAEAVVKGTQNRYGFAVVDDGREIFIPPDEMLKVLPGDRVAICIRPAPPSREKNAKPGRSVAEIEKLIDSSLGRFVGKIVNKGKALFVAPDLPNLNRWLFIPPHARNGAKPGDYVECALLRHPIRDGKPSAKVLNLLGDATTPGIENRYCAIRAGLSWEWPERTAQAMAEHIAQRAPGHYEQRQDLTHLSFITIDAARTQDIDDALYAEVTQSGWDLYIAVADPTEFLADAPQIGDVISERATSVYFHGDMLPMLPEGISQEHAALAENETRPALVCKVTVSEAGELGAFEFSLAQVRSRAKLAYPAVDRYVTGNSNELIAFSNPLEALVQAYRALRNHRERTELVMEDRTEYRWLLGEDRQIESIEQYEKLASQHLVEECMVAANRCAAAWMASKNAPGPYVGHAGFRKDRLDEAKVFLQKYQPELVDTDITTVSGYRTVLAQLAKDNQDLPLRNMVNRLLTRAEYVDEPLPHMGMALSTYTNFTSPLRKAIDFLVHLQIKSLLTAGQPMSVSRDTLQAISKAQGRAREATLAAERWLTGNYLRRLAASGTTQFSAEISQMSSAGFTVRLSDSGLEGQVDLRKDPEKFSFDKWTASLTSTTRRFQVGQTIRVDFVSALPVEGGIPEFSVVAGEGAKLEKVQSETPPIETPSTS
jgi:VacB/RNase II family 3'-5' exoribonuclease